MEQRLHPRAKVNGAFDVFGDYMREYALDISATGAFIRTAEVVPVGTQVQFRFTVVGDDIETIEGQGRVMRAVEPADSDTPGLGIVFTNLAEPSQAALARVVSSGAATVVVDASELHAQRRHESAPCAKGPKENSQP